MNKIVDTINGKTSWEVPESDVVWICVAFVLCSLFFSVAAYNIVCVVWK